MFSKFFSAALLFSLLLIGTRPATAQLSATSFTDATLSAGLTNDTGEILSVAWLDFDGDGNLDLWLGNHFGYDNHIPFLFINQGDGTFVNIIDQVWSANPLEDTHGAAWADYDNDGDPDLLELIGSGRGFGVGANHFFENQNGVLVERAAAVGLDYPLGQGRMGTWFDYDKDGLLDAIVVSPPTRADGQAAPTTIFRQLPDGTFEDVGAAAGISITENGQIVQVSDVTGDGVMDLVLQSIAEMPHRVYSGADDPFVDLADALFPTRFSSGRGFTVGDFNGDTFMDLYFLRRKQGPQAVQFGDTLLIAQMTPASAFTVTSAGFLRLEDERAPGDGEILSGVPIFIGENGVDLGTGFASILLDAADPDVWGVDTTVRDSGLVIGYDTATNTWSVDFIAHPLNRQLKLVASTDGVFSALDMPKGTNFEQNDVLWIFNPDTGQFEDQTAAAGLDFGTDCTAAAPGDFDNDMDLDLYLSCVEIVLNQPNYLFENQGDGTFVVVPMAGGAVGDSVGVGIEAMNKQGRVITADYDEDGFLDLFVPGVGYWSVQSRRLTEVPYIPSFLFKNNGNGHHWLQLDLTGTVSNRDGLGARVYVTAGGKKQLREQTGGYRWYMQDGMRLHFGLGVHAVADTVEIHWPSGIIQTLTNVDADQILAVTEGVDPNATPLLAHLRADTGTGTNTTGDPVAQWDDLSVNALHATQTDPAHQPTAALDALAFDATTAPQAMLLPVSPLINTQAPYHSRTLTLVFETGADVNRRQVLYDEGGTSRGLTLYLDAGRLYAGAWNLADDDGVSPWGPFFVSGAIEAATPYVVTLRYDASGAVAAPGRAAPGNAPGTVALYINGVEAEVASGAGLLYNHERASIGARFNAGRFHDWGFTGAGYAEGFTGSLAEVLLYQGALPTAERQALESSLFDAYGIAAGPVPLLWLRSEHGVTAATGTLTDGARISRWADAGPHALDAIQGITTVRPSYRASGIAGRPSLTFAGAALDGTPTPEAMRLPVSPLLNNGGPYAARTVTVVFETGSDVTRRQVVYEEGGNVRGLGLYLDKGTLYGGAWNRGSDDAVSPWGPLFVSASVTTLTPYVATLVYAGGSASVADGTVTLYVNGVEVGSLSGAGLVYSHAIGSLGARRDNGRYHDWGFAGTGHFEGLAGEMGEFRLYDGALTTSERAVVESWLGSHWGVTVSSSVSGRVAAAGALVGAVATSTEDALPSAWALDVYPNPFSAQGWVALNAGTTGAARVAVYDVLGRRVAALFDGTVVAGNSYRWSFSGTNLPSGLYFVRMEGGDRMMTRKMLLVR